MIKENIKINFNSKAAPFFKGLTFNEQKHEYHVGERRVPKSVSGLITSFKKKVDFDKIAGAIAKRDGLRKEDILAEWKKKNVDACESGTDTHNFAEIFDDKIAKADTEKKKAVLRFWSDVFKNNPGRYILIARELRMYHKKFFFSGTCDFIVYDILMDSLIIGDYKTNQDLFKCHNDTTLLPPFYYLEDSNYNHYQIQLSFYDILLKQLEFAPVSERWIVWLLPDGTYKLYKGADFSPTLNTWLENNYNGN